MGFRKGQAALDFLMTYGWAIALVVIIAAVLFSLGVFDVSNFLGNKASGFSGVAVTGWNLAPGGAFTIKLANQVGQKIQVNSVNVTIGTESQLTSLPALPLATGVSSETLNAAFSNQTASSSYTAQVTIGYTDLNANFNYTTTGTLTGKVA